MKFVREELDFLKLYVMLSDTRSFLNDKIHINFIKEKDSIIFSQLSYKFNLITVLQKNLSTLKESFNILVETNQLFSLVSLLPKNSEINISKEEISFEGSKYQLPKYEGDYSVVDKFLLLTSSPKVEEIKIVDLEKMPLIKNYAGIDELDTIGIIENYFVASNRTDVAGAIKTSNTINDIIFLPTEIASIITSYGLKSIVLNKVEFNETIYNYFIINQTYVIINNMEYALANIFEDNVRELYDHPTFVKINKNNLLQALTRILVVAKNNIYNRIFISFDTNNMIIESIDTGYSVEKVPFIKLSNEIQNVKITVSASNVKTILQSLQGNEVTIKISPEQDSTAISFVDENNNSLFVHTLYENIEE